MLLLKKLSAHLKKVKPTCAVSPAVIIPNTLIDQVFSCRPGQLPKHVIRRAD